MPEHRVPQWHPIEALPMMGQAIDGMLASAEDVVQSLEQARPLWVATCTVNYCAACCSI